LRYLPATILITITGATLLANTDEPWIRITVGIIGIIAAILSAIQTFYSYAKRAETHRLIASQLGQVRRDIEILERVVPKSETEMEQRIREINNSISEIDKEAPAIDIKAIRNLPDIRTMLNRAHDKHMP
jgi:hypothetical protein